MKVFYYYYYLFYTRVLPDNEPHATVIFTLSFSESLLLNGILQVFLAKVYCLKLGVIPMVSVLVFLLCFNYIFYSRTKKSRAIIAEKPKFFSSEIASIIFTGLFGLASLSFLFIIPLIVKEILDQCRMYN